MKQLFKAVDSHDEELSWFFFDGKGNVLVTVAHDDETTEKMVAYLKDYGAAYPELAGDRDRMIDPVLVAEWE